MVKIGNREMIASHSLIIPKDETAVIDLEALGNKLALSIKFVEEEESRSVRVTATSKVAADMIFVNWNNSIGMSLKAPVALLDVEGDKVFFMAANYRIEDTNHFHIQFLLVRKPK